MLEHDILRGSSGEGGPVVVLLHGRGADRKDLAGLRPHLPPNWTLVLPDAPFPGAPWGYGMGRAWYRFLGRNRPEPDSFEASLSAIDVFLEEVREQLDAEAGRVYVGGFSQGGTVSLGWALAKAGGRLDGAGAAEPVRAGIINLSGFLADHPWTEPAADVLKGVRLFWGHGTQDPNIAFDLAVEGRTALGRTGVELEARDYPIGHWIDGAELGDVVTFVDGDGGT